MATCGFEQGARRSSCSCVTPCSEVRERCLITTGRAAVYRVDRQERTVCAPVSARLNALKDVLARTGSDWPRRVEASKYLAEGCVLAEFALSAKLTVRQSFTATCARGLRRLNLINVMYRCKGNRASAASASAHDLVASKVNFFPPARHRPAPWVALNWRTSRRAPRHRGAGKQLDDGIERRHCYFCDGQVPSNVGHSSLRGSFAT